MVSDELLMVVGRYAADGRDGLRLYAFDQDSASFEMLDSIDLAAPSYLTADQASDTLYVVNELKDETACLVAVHVDRHRRQLQMMSAARTGGASPCHVAKCGDVVATANYRGGSVSLFQLSKTSESLSLQSIIRGTSGGPDKTRQDMPHVHSVLFSPDGHYLLATDFSADSIMVIQVMGTLLHATIPIIANSAGGYGPRHMAFSPDSHFLYVIGELSDCVTVYAYHEGTLTEVQTVIADEDHGRGGAHIRFSPDGAFLYTSHRRRNDKIVIFSVNTHNGQLTKIGTQPTKCHPRQFTITPNGRYLLVGCMDDHMVQIFQRDPLTGLLSDTHQSITVYSPAFVGFI